MLINRLVFMRGNFSYLHIAQKNSIAKEVSNILSKGTKRLGHSHSQYNPVYQFMLDNEHNKFTSVRGHIFDHELGPECKSWISYDNKKILTQQANMVKKYGTDVQPIIKNIEQYAKKATVLILWLDCDRQGQAIAFQVIEVAKKVNWNLKIKRARFSALTSIDINTAYANLVQPNRLEADAVNYRIEIDFRMGCTFTRYQSVVFSKYFKLKNQTVLSYGTCQIPTLGFVVQRYLEIRNFNSEKYWFIQCWCIMDTNKGVQFKWNRKNTRNQLQANSIIVKMMLSAEDNGLLYGQITKKNNYHRKKYRPYPLTTVKLQKLATDKLKMSSNKVMEIAQKLYMKGYISYPRTQTNSFPKTMNLKQLIQNLKPSSEYGSYISKLLDGNCFMQPKIGNQDDNAHSPIHPVRLINKSMLTNQQWDVYDMVCRTFLACCSNDAIGQEFQVQANIGNQFFKASYLTIKAKNYLQIYHYEKWTQTSFPDQIPQKFPCQIKLTQSQTKAPNYLTQADLIGQMQKNQIGTDSTIHQHIQTIQTRNYAIKTGNTFKPTNLGASLICTYRKLGIKLPQCQIRRMIESTMHDISNGKRYIEDATRSTLQSIIPIYEQLRQIQSQWMTQMNHFMMEHNNLSQVSMQEVSTNNSYQSSDSIIGVCYCVLCNSQSRINYSKRTMSYFMGCSKYPQCQWSYPLPKYISTISLTQDRCILCSSLLCMIQVQNKQLIQSEAMKNRFNEQNKLILCLKPNCDKEIYNFRPIWNNNQQQQSRNYTMIQNQQSNRNIRQYQQPKCYSCGQKGHYSKDCRSITKDKKYKYQKQKQKYESNSFTNKFKCFSCGQVGHIAPKCPHKSHNCNTNNKSISNKKIINSNKKCPVCGIQGRHPKNSTCAGVKHQKRNNKYQ